MSGLRLLLCGPAASDVLDDLAAGLGRLGWQVDCASAPPRTMRDLPCGGPWADGRVQRAVRRVTRDLDDAAQVSDWFVRLEATLARGDHQVVLAYLDVLPPGLARLVTRSRATPILVSLVALAQELRYRHLLPPLRLAARAGAGRALHPDVLRAADPRRLGTVVCPTQTWLDDTVAAGLPPARGRVIRFGIQLPPDPVVRAAALGSPVRLLWAGRLAPEKGLHLFLEALPLVAAHRRVTLTAIAAPGPACYAARLAQTIRASSVLASIVSLKPAVPRRDLAREYASHDVLLFHSVFAEPVAQVVLAAAASGLPVVGPLSHSPRSLLREGHTAWCYRDATPACIADAICRALADGDARVAYARALDAEVRRDHDVVQTITSYDALLRACIGAGCVTESVHG